MKYTYEFSNEENTIEINEYWLDILTNLDKTEWANQKKESRRHCLIAISKSNGDSGDYTIVAKSEKISSLIKEKYPDTANQLKKLF